MAETVEQSDGAHVVLQRHCSAAARDILDRLPDYDRFIIEIITETLRAWIDKRRHNVVWLHKIDIDQLEEWAAKSAEKYRETELYCSSDLVEPLQQPNEGWTPAKPWPHVPQ